MGVVRTVDKLLIIQLRTSFRHNSKKFRSDKKNYSLGFAKEEAYSLTLFSHFFFVLKVLSEDIFLKGRKTNVREADSVSPRGRLLLPAPFLLGGVLCHQCGCLFAVLLQSA